MHNCRTDQQVFVLLAAVAVGVNSLAVGVATPAATLVKVRSYDLCSFFFICLQSTESGFPPTGKQGKGKKHKMVAIKLKKRHLLRAGKNNLPKRETIHLAILPQRTSLINFPLHFGCRNMLRRLRLLLFRLIRYYISNWVKIIDITLN